MAKKKKITKIEEPVQNAQQNGITRPKEGTKTGTVWAIADEISKTTGEPAKRGAVMQECETKSINSSTATTQFGRWRRFYGLDQMPTQVDPKAKKKNKVVEVIVSPEEIAEADAEFDEEKPELAPKS